MDYIIHNSESDLLQKVLTMNTNLTPERALLYSLLRAALNGEELPPGVSLRELIILRFRAYRRVKNI